MLLPSPRGPLSAALVAALREADPAAVPGARLVATTDDVVSDEDRQLALWICAELPCRGFADGADFEWEPRLVALRRNLENELLAQLRAEVRVPPGRPPVADRLRRMIAGDDGPPLARFVQQQASRRQFTEFVIHRSIYHLKEADPHSWALPRLSGRPKAALVEIQADEYGGGSLPRMHSELFRRTMRGLGLDDTYGRFIDAVPAVTLAVNNVMSLFALRRALRGALAGHLAAFEMTSSAPNRRYSLGLRRLGVDDNVRRFYDEHVTADALHEQIAAHDLCGALVEDEPELAGDVLFGAAAALHIDNRWADHVLQCWTTGRSSLRSEPALAAPIADVS
jgi:Iron-containing redox enzyme